MRPFFFLLIFFLGCAFSLAGAQTNGYPVDPELGFATGPAIGETVPEFSLPDQDGTVRSLRRLLGEKGAILNFYRSADW